MKGHLTDLPDFRACCRACGDGCETWTYHPDSGCQLYGKLQPQSFLCYDGEKCVTGPNVKAGSPLPPVGQANPPANEWRLPTIDWTSGGVVGPTDKYAVRAFDMIFWEPENKWYMYCDLVLFSNPECPGAFGSEIGVFSADSLDTEWTYHGIAVHKNTTLEDAGGLATPTATVHNGKFFVYFAYEGLPVGKGLRGIGGAIATHPLGPFTRTAPVAVAPAGWHRPRGPGGILNDPGLLRDTTLYPGL